jgi:hypothetical protein
VGAGPRPEKLIVTFRFSKRLVTVGSAKIWAAIVAAVATILAAMIQYVSMTAPAHHLVSQLETNNEKLQTQLAAAQTAAVAPVAPTAGPDERIRLQAPVEHFGKAQFSCEISGDGLKITIQKRGADFGLCCASLASPRSLGSYTQIQASVETEKPEKKVDVKLEDGGNHVFMVWQQRVDTAQPVVHILTEQERSWFPKKACIGVLGLNGPVPNALAVRNIKFIK